MKIDRKVLILTSILLLALLLRTIGLANTPYPLNGDEAALGYNAYSIGHFGTDEYQNKFPLYFSSIGDYKYPLYTYLSVPLTLIFGLNAFSTRLLSVISGVLLVFVVYKFTKLLFENETVALIASLVAAISPWNLIFSRTASISNLATTLTLVGVYFLTVFLKEKYKSKKNLVYSTLAFVAAIYAYPSPRIVIPAFLFFVLVSFFSFRKRKDKSKSKHAVFLVILFLLIDIISIVPKQSRARATDLSILSSPEGRNSWIQTYTTELGWNGSTPVLLTRSYFNKGTALFWDVTQRYLSHFSPDFLFLNGDRVQINAIPNTGIFYLTDLVFIVIGTAFLFVNLNFENSIPIIFMLTAPLAASLSVETPSSLRMLIGMPGFAITIATGIYVVFEKLKKRKVLKKLFVVITSTAYIYFFVFLLVNLFKIAPVHKPWFTDQGTKAMVEYVWENKDRYDAVAIHGDDYIHFLFYEKLSPQAFTQNSHILPASEKQWDRVSSFYNIFFNMTPDCPKIGKENVLYVCRGQEIPRNATIVKTITFKDGIPAYTLITLQKMSFVKEKQPLPEHLFYMVGEEDTRYPEGIFPQTHSDLW